MVVKAVAETVPPVAARDAILAIPALRSIAGWGCSIGFTLVRDMDAASVAMSVAVAAVAAKADLAKAATWSTLQFKAAQLRDTTRATMEFPRKFTRIRRSSRRK